VFFVPPPAGTYIYVGRVQCGGYVYTPGVGMIDRASAERVGGLLRGRVASRAAWGGERKITTEGTELHGVLVTDPVFSV
jgi:hypothetical protein